MTEEQLDSIKRKCSRAYETFQRALAIQDKANKQVDWAYAEYLVAKQRQMDANKEMENQTS